MASFLMRCATATLFCLAMGAACAAEAPAFDYAVVCDEPALAQRLRTGIEQRFAKLHVQVRDRLPAAKLFIYASRDTNDKRNIEGVSVAIAHVSNMAPAALALSYIKRNEPMPEMLQSMLREEGMLMHLNVAHMTTPSDAEVNELLDKIVTAFVRKYMTVPEDTAPATQR